MQAGATKSWRVIVTLVALSAPWLASHRAAAEPSAPDLCAVASSGSDFRIRAAAAASLGRSREACAGAALDAALGDPHPAVRAAAAAALGERGDRATLAALERAALRETTPTVKEQMTRAAGKLRVAPAADLPARFLVAVGRLENKSGVDRGALTAALRAKVRAELSEVEGGELLAEGADLEAAQKSRKLPVFALDGTLTKLSRQEAGGSVACSATVELLLRELPAHSLRSAVSGAAQVVADARSVRGDVEKMARLESNAIAGAVESAMQRLPTVLVAAAKNAAPAR
jgi:hypothetical protein